MAQSQENIVVGLDIGTTKICCVVAEVAAGEVNIIGIGTHPSIGLRKGVVVNIESTVESIKKAVEEAELMAGCEISSVYAGIAGGHITGFNSRGIIAIKGPEITEGDVERVIDAARAVAIPMDREVIHVLPQEFIVDDQAGIQNPVGMAGVRLEAKIHIVTGAVTSAHNIVKCANRSGWMSATSSWSRWPPARRCSPERKRNWAPPSSTLGAAPPIWPFLRQEHPAHLRAGPGRQQPDQRHRHRPAGTPCRGGKDQKKYGTCLRSASAAMKPSRSPAWADAARASSAAPDSWERFWNPAWRRSSPWPSGKSTGPAWKTSFLRGGPHRRHVPAGRHDRDRRIGFQPAHPAGRPQGISGLVDVVNNPMYATGVGLVLYGAQKPDGKNFASGTNIFNRIMTR
jgi:cell division protein FtsA